MNYSKFNPLELGELTINRQAVDKQFGNLLVKDIVLTSIEKSVDWKSNSKVYGYLTSIRQEKYVIIPFMYANELLAIDTKELLLHSQEIEYIKNDITLACKQAQIVIGAYWCFQDSNKLTMRILYTLAVGAMIGLAIAILFGKV
jgi:hypothetical protein